MRAIATIIFWLIYSFGLLTAAELPLDLRVKLQNLSKAQDPFVFHSYIVFSYQGDYEEVSSAKIAFENLPQRSSHEMMKNGYNVYIYWLPVTNECSTVNYRYIINGLWSRDYLNNSHFINEYGAIVSSYAITEQPPLAANPVKENDGYGFYFSAAAKQYIYLVGSFNSWQPFATPLKEIEAGKYYVKLQLSRGEYLYYFHHRGSFKVDPQSGMKSGRYSKFIIE